MTKHNGKARNAGDKVGKALLASRKKSRTGPGGNGRHTTELHGGATNMQSVLERNDLDELMAMADLAGRDFTAERSQVVVISNGTVDAIEEQRAAEERAAAEERNRHRLKLPRRPSWDESTTPEQLDAQERTAFVAWRRDLALLEEQEKLVLTPFEKNLEVWRQLWRVLERSDIVVQVVDARDPMLYRCEDLEAYARELNACKGSLLLLNKADLLPLAVRQRWADYLDKIGMPYAFWSAVAVIDHHASLRAEAQDLGLDWKDLSEQRHTEARLARLSEEAAAMASGACGEAEVLAARRTRVLGEDELVALLEERAREAVLKAGKEDPQALDHDRKLTVGLVGYPNVGKSSTINALFGAKKTAVAPTPGKTKHFQTLVVSPTLSLCDCPGLVMPKFARSKAEMVAAGVIPIDRLTEIRAPVEVLASRVGRGQMEQLYGFKLPPAPVTAPGAPPTAEQVLRSLATGRGWVVGSGLPDESRAGRLMLRDYTSGRLLHCTLPPGSNPSSYVPFIHDPNTLRPLGSGAHATRAVGAIRPAVGAAATASSESEAEEEDSGALLQGATQRLPDLDDADLDLLAGELGDLEVGPGGVVGGSKPKRADHKFQKKAARSKGDRGQGLQNLGGGYDGAMVATGKKGGLLRVG